MVREGSQGFDADLAGDDFFTGFSFVTWAAIAVKSEFLRADQLEHPIFAKDLDTVHTEKKTKVFVNIDLTKFLLLIWNFN